MNLDCNGEVEKTDSSSSSQKLNIEAEDTNLDVGFVQKDVIDEFLGIKDEVGVITKENSSEFANFSQSDSGCKLIELGFEKKDENFDRFIQNSSKSEDLTSSLIVEVIDDSAIGNSPKIEEEKRNRNRRRGKKGNSNCSGLDFTDDSNVRKRMCVYSRKEMEVLRYVNVKAQKKLWQEIYDGFSAIIKKEYDELGSFRHKKVKGSFSVSDHNQIGGKRNSSNGGISGDSCMNSSSNSTYDDDIGQNDGQYGVDLEEEWSEDEESDDEYENMQRPAFKVEGEPNFESGPPEDGIEYLRRVRWEAKQIPKVKIAKLNNIKVKDQSVYMPTIPDIQECPPHLAPLTTWEDEFIADFSDLRLALSSLEDSSDEASVDPETIIFARQGPKTNSSKHFAMLELSKSGEPLLSTILEMEPVTRVAMLSKRISLFENCSEFSKDECCWIFALCAVIDTPLDADTCASLRCLLRRCAKLRAEKTEFDDEVAMLNVLATISGRVFGQLEK